MTVLSLNPVIKTVYSSIASAQSAPLIWYLACCVAPMQTVPLRASILSQRWRSFILDVFRPLLSVQSWREALPRLLYIWTHSLLNQFFCHWIVWNSTKTLALSCSHCHGQLSFVTSQRGWFRSHWMFYCRHQWINVDNNGSGWIKLLKGATKQWRNNQAHDFSWRARPPWAFSISPPWYQRKRRCFA